MNFLIKAEIDVKAGHMACWLHRTTYSELKKRLGSWVKARQVMGILKKEAAIILERQIRRSDTFVKDFVFGILFNPNSDVGDIILSFVPGRKGSWFVESTAARAGHMYLLLHLHRVLINYPMGQMSHENGRFYQTLWGRAVELSDVKEFSKLVMVNAIKGGQLHVLQWVHFYLWNCGQEEANVAALYNRLEILQWMKGFGIHMSFQGYNWALEREYTDILIFFHSYKFQ